MLNKLDWTLCLGVVLAAFPWASVALADQPVRPLIKVGHCPSGYHTSASYCVPSSSRSRGALPKVGSGCPSGFYTSGSYCLSNPSNRRQAIEKTGSSCPSGWFTSGRYCLQSR